MLSFDHLVIASKNIAKESKQFGELYDIKTVKGGEHENWGTANYLGFFANNCYIEWLGIQNDGIAKQSDNPLIQHLVYRLQDNVAEPYQLAFRTNNLEHYLSHFTTIGLPFIGPVDGKRRKPDGTLLTWRMLFPIYDRRKETLPFLIAWDQTENERVDSTLINEKTIDSLHFGGTTLEKFTEVYNISPEQIEQRKVVLPNATIEFSSERQHLAFTI